MGLKVAFGGIEHLATIPRNTSVAKFFHDQMALPVFENGAFSVLYRLWTFRTKKIEFYDEE